MSFLSHSAAQKATESIYFISYDWCLRINNPQKSTRESPLALVWNQIVNSLK